MQKFYVATLFVYFISVAFVHGQDFIVTAKGDTLRGKIKITSTNIGQRMQVVTPAKEKKTYSVVQIRLALIDSVVYHPVKFGQSYSFMKLIKSGYLNLYAFQSDNQLTYDRQYLLKKDGVGIEVPNLSFKKSMTKFLSECPTVASEISNRTLGRNDVIKIVDSFNQCIENNTRLLVTKDLPSTISTSLSEIWIMLEDKIKASTISEKKYALEMVADIKTKLKRGEKIPAFLSEGLKSMVSTDAEVVTALNKALESID
jgi:hypothetical protein